MEDIKPFLVSAPLLIDTLDDVDTKTIYVFDYENSFKFYDNKASKLISYIESIGGMNDIFVPLTTKYEDKEKLLLEYFNSGSFFNIYSLTNTMIKILFKVKNIPSDNNSIMSDSEIDVFIRRNKQMINDMITFYNSLFMVMLLYSILEIKTIKELKKRYTKDRINRQEFSPNLCNLLLCSEFYEYYTKHVGNDLYYYEFLFDNNLYMSRSFIDVLANSENKLLPVMFDLNNDKFLNFIQEEQKRGH